MTKILNSSSYQKLFASPSSRKEPTSDKLEKLDENGNIIKSAEVS